MQLELGSLSAADELLARPISASVVCPKKRDISPGRQDTESGPPVARRILGAATVAGLRSPLPPQPVFCPRSQSFERRQIGLFACPLPPIVTGDLLAS